jgi:hypothetical protein
MSDTQSASAAQPDYRLVVYPHPATGKPAEDAPVVQFAPFNRSAACPTFSIPHCSMKWG